MNVYKINIYDIYYMVKLNLNLKKKEQVLQRKLKNTANTIDRKIENTIDRVENTAKEILYGATELPLSVLNLLKLYGNETIKSISIHRTPVPQVITGALNVFSFGKFGKNMQKNDFDTLFHLFLEVVLESNKIIQLEKNERINFILSPPSRPKTEIQNIDFSQPNLTLNMMMENTKNLMGQKFLSYGAKSNNCQDFILAILNSNNLGNEEDKTFVKQNTESLFNKLPYLRKLSNTLTTTGAKLNTLISGGGMKKNCCPMCGTGLKQNLKKTFTPKLGRKITDLLIKEALPNTISALTESAIGAVTENPVIAATLGKTLGDELGRHASNSLSKVVDKQRSKKGSGLKTNTWLQEVKQIQNKMGISYKEALQKASEMRRNK